MLPESGISASGGPAGVPSVVPFVALIAACLGAMVFVVMVSFKTLHRQTFVR